MRERVFIPLAARADQLFGQDLVAIASIAVIVSSVLWIIVSRLVVRNLRNAAQITQATPLPVEPIRPARDIWSQPPLTTTVDSEEARARQGAK